MGTNWNDPFITSLKSIGYCPIRHPRANVSPLQLLSESGKGELDHLGDLTDVFTSDDPTQVPSVKVNQTAANVTGRRTSDLTAGLGLTFLGNVIGAMGGSSAALKAHYRRARTIAFRFEHVLTDIGNVAELDKFLEQCDLDSAG